MTSSQIESYEQKYSVLVAEITSRIGRLKIKGNDNSDTLTKQIQTNFEEANDLLEQLDLEVQVSGGQTSRVACHKAELQRIRDEFTQACGAAGSSFVDGIDQFDDWNGGSDQRMKLIQNSDRNGRVAVHDSYKVHLEIESLDGEVSEDIDLQERTRERLRMPGEELNTSTRLLQSSAVKSIQERFFVYLFILIFAIMLFGALYFTL